ncbi:MAG: MMPL family transporter [Cytophagales bacterium]|nr:MMPL family transporter [Cytophagales bacterium]
MNYQGIPLLRLFFRYPYLFLTGLALFFLFMLYHAFQVEFSFQEEEIIPSDSPEMRSYRKYSELFEIEERYVVIIGFTHENVFEKAVFEDVQDFTQNLQDMEGVKHVLSLSSAVYPKRNDKQKTFLSLPIFPKNISSQGSLDSLKEVFYQYPLYKGVLYNPGSHTYISMVRLDSTSFDSPQRDQLMSEFFRHCQDFEERLGKELYLGGLPYMRYIFDITLKKELIFSLLLFTLASLAGVFWIFRTYQPVLISAILTGIMMVSVLGTLSLLDYGLGLFTAISFPVIAIIGMVNCVYSFHKFRQVYDRSGDKRLAVLSSFRYMGYLLAMTNLSIGMGFFLLSQTRTPILQQIGWVSCINIILTLNISMILIFTMLLYLPAPQRRKSVYVHPQPNIRFIFSFIKNLVRQKRLSVLCITGILCVGAIFGILRLESRTRIIDDILSKELRREFDFFEEHMKGMVPLDIVLDLGLKRGARHLRKLQKTNEIHQLIDSLPFFSNPISVLSLVSATRQAFYEADSSFYDIPTYREIVLMAPYLRNMLNSEENKYFYSRFLDETERYLRITFRTKDVDNKVLNSWLNQHLEPRMNDLKKAGIDGFITGPSWLFLKGNAYILKELLWGMFFSSLVLALIMGFVFRKLYIIFLSLSTCLLPLICVAGFMGYLDIPVQFSTVLVFGVCFCISVSNTIHFLACHRRELKFHKNMKVAINSTMKNLGLSMFYASFVLFLGFSMLGFSSFRDPTVLGLLVSVALFFTCLSHLIILPTLFLVLDRGNSLVRKT